MPFAKQTFLVSPLPSVTPWTPWSLAGWEKPRDCSHRLRPPPPRARRPLLVWALPAASSPRPSELWRRGPNAAPLRDTQSAQGRAARAPRDQVLSELITAVSPPHATRGSGRAEISTRPRRTPVRLFPREEFFLAGPRSLLLQPGLPRPFLRVRDAWLALCWSPSGRWGWPRPP